MTCSLQAVQGISDLIINAGMINVDFADVKTIMSSNGRALMGTGIAKGDRRALEAAEMAVNSPLLDEVSVQGATGILINFTAGPDIKLREINEAAGLVQQAAHEEAEIIFGVVTDSNLSDTVKVTVIATGFEKPGHAPIPLGIHQAVSSQQAITPHPPIGWFAEPRIAAKIYLRRSREFPQRCRRRSELGRSAPARSTTRRCSTSRPIFAAGPGRRSRTSFIP